MSPKLIRAVLISSSICYGEILIPIIDFFNIKGNRNNYTLSSSNQIIQIQIFGYMNILITHITINHREGFIFCPSCRSNQFPFCLQSMIVTFSYFTCFLYIMTIFRFPT